MPPEPSGEPERTDGQEDRARAVYAIYGLVAGAVLMLSGLAVILFDVFRESENVRVLGFGIFLVLLGGTAALPKIFMPILSAVLKKVPGRSETIEPPTLTAKKPRPDDDEN